MNQNYLNALQKKLSVLVLTLILTATLPGLVLAMNLGAQLGGLQTKLVGLKGKLGQLKGGLEKLREALDGKAPGLLVAVGGAVMTTEWNDCSFLMNEAAGKPATQTNLKGAYGPLNQLLTQKNLESAESIIITLPQKDLKALDDIHKNATVLSTLKNEKYLPNLTTIGKIAHILSSIQNDVNNIFSDSNNKDLNSVLIAISDKLKNVDFPSDRYKILLIQRAFKSERIAASAQTYQQIVNRVKRFGLEEAFKDFNSIKDGINELSNEATVAKKINDAFQSVLPIDPSSGPWWILGIRDFVVKNAGELVGLSKAAGAKTLELDSEGLPKIFKTVAVIKKPAASSGGKKPAVDEMNLITLLKKIGNSRSNLTLGNLLKVIIDEIKSASDPEKNIIKEFIERLDDSKILPINAAYLLEISEIVGVEQSKKDSISKKIPVTKKVASAISGALSSILSVGMPKPIVKTKTTYDSASPSGGGSALAGNAEAAKNIIMEKILNSRKETPAVIVGGPPPLPSYRTDIELTAEEIQIIIDNRSGIQKVPTFGGEKNKLKTLVTNKKATFSDKGADGLAVLTALGISP